MHSFKTYVILKLLDCTFCCIKNSEWPNWHFGTLLSEQVTNTQSNSKSKTSHSLCNHVANTTDSKNSTNPLWLTRHTKLSSLVVSTHGGLRTQGLGLLQFRLRAMREERKGKDFGQVFWGSCTLRDPLQPQLAALVVGKLASAHKPWQWHWQESTKLLNNDTNKTSHIVKWFKLMDSCLLLWRAISGSKGFWWCSKLFRNTLSN